MARLFRDFILIVFGFLVTTALPALNDLLVATSIPLLNKTKLLIIIVIAGVPYLWLLYHLGKIEERQQEKRDTKLVEDILSGLGYKQIGNKSEHFDSVL